MAEKEQPRGGESKKTADQDTNVAHCYLEKRTEGCGVAAFVSAQLQTHRQGSLGGGGVILEAPSYQPSRTLALQSGSVGSLSRLYTQSQRAGPRRMSGISQTPASAPLGNSWSTFHHNTNSGIVPIPKI